MQYWIYALSAFLISLFLIRIAIFVFPRIGFMDRPHKYGLKRSPIPYYGGLTIYFAFLISLLLFVPGEKNIWGLALGATLIVLIGFIDDFYAISPFCRLFVQFFAGIILVVSGVGILSINLPIFGNIDLTGININFGPGLWKIQFYLFSALFTIFWVMIFINALNFLDGVSGLSSGVTFISSLTIFFLSIHPLIHENPLSQLSIAKTSIILAMIALAFLIHDFPRPKILPGDTGSTFFGFLLGTLAIFAGGKVATAIIVLGLPILDMLWAIIRRITQGRKFWQGDLHHLHHRLLGVGLSERKVVFLYLLITAILGLIAVLLVSSMQKFFMIIALTIFVAILLGALILIPKRLK